MTVTLCRVCRRPMPIRGAYLDARKFYRCVPCLGLPDPTTTAPPPSPDLKLFDDEGTQP